MASPRPLLKCIELLRECHTDEEFNATSEEIWTFQSPDGKLTAEVFFAGDSLLPSWNAADFHYFAVDGLRAVSKVNPDGTVIQRESETLGECLELRIPNEKPPHFVTVLLELLDHSDRKSFWSVDDIDHKPPSKASEADFRDAYLFGIIRGALNDDAITRRRKLSAANSLALDKQKVLDLLQHAAASREPENLQVDLCVKEVASELKMGKSTLYEKLKLMGVKPDHWLPRKH